MLEDIGNIVHLVCKWIHVGMLDAFVELSATAEAYVLYPLDFIIQPLNFGFFNKHWTTAILDMRGEITIML